MKENQDVIQSLEHICQGLRLCDLLDVIRGNQEIFNFVFCVHNELQYNFDKIEDLLLPEFSQDGSSRKAQEINTLKVLVDCLELCCEQGNNAFFFLKPCFQQFFYILSNLITQD